MALSEMVRSEHHRGTGRSGAANKAWASLGALVCLWLLASPSGSEEIGREAQVKATFVLKFASYVKWPATAFADETGPLLVGAFGEGPVVRGLEQIFRSERIGKRRVVVRQIESVDQLELVHVVFVDASLQGRTEEILGVACGLPVLTVGDLDGFADSGGIINLFEDKGNIRFEINRRCARLGGLRISSRLLSLARLVDLPEDEESKRSAIAPVTGERCGPGWKNPHDSEGAAWREAEM